MKSNKTSALSKTKSLIYSGVCMATLFATEVALATKKLSGAADNVNNETSSFWLAAESLFALGGLILVGMAIFGWEKASKQGETAKVGKQLFFGICAISIFALIEYSTGSLLGGDGQATEMRDRIVKTQ